MMKKLGFGALIALALVVLPGSAYAATNAELEAQIKQLLEMVSKLQAQVAALHGQQQQIVSALKIGLKEGMTDEDVKKLQELLATDPTVYPEGKVTGYFGPLTKAAVTRFQQKFELKVTGEVDEDTHDYLEELLKERFNGKIPPGLLTAPGIAKKVELRIKEGCDGGKIKAGGLLCQKIKVKYGDDENDDANDDDDDDSNDDANDDDANDDDDSEEVDEIVALIHADEGETHVTVTYEDGSEDEFEYSTTSESTIIEELADELDMDEDDVEDLIDFEDSADEIESIEVEFEDGDSDVRVERGDGSHETFTLDTTKHNEVIEEIADKLDIDEDDVRDLIEWKDGELEIEVVTEDGSAEVDVTYENGSHSSFSVDSDDEDDIIDEIVDRTGLSQDEVEDAIAFDHN